MSSLRRLAPLVIALVLVAGCDSSSRPPPELWRIAWEDMVGAVPAEDDLGSPPDQEVCQTTLAAVRERSAELFPSPSVTVDDLALEWIAIAERSFFECPPDGQDITSFSDAYEELDRVERSVSEALED